RSRARHRVRSTLAAQPRMRREKEGPGERGALVAEDHENRLPEARAAVAHGRLRSRSIGREGARGPAKAEWKPFVGRGDLPVSTRPKAPGEWAARDFSQGLYGKRYPDVRTSQRPSTRGRSIELSEIPP